MKIRKGDRARLVCGAAAGVLSWAAAAAATDPAVIATPASQPAHGFWSTNKPIYGLIGIGAVAMLGEFLLDQAAHSAYNAYVANPTDAGFAQAVKLQSTRNVMPIIYAPALSVSVGWWGYRAWHRAPAPPMTEAQRVATPAAVPPAAPTMAPMPPLTGSDVHVRAQERFQRGVAYYQSGNKYSALQEFTNCADLDPSYPGVQDWITRLNREMSASVPSPVAVSANQQRVVDTHMRLGNDLYAAGEWKKAAAEYRLVEELTGPQSEAAHKRVEAQSRMDQVLRQRLTDARDWKARGDLAREIAALEAALHVDNENVDATRALADARARVPGEVERLYRLGLNQYANEGIEEAIATWKKALVLDPTDKPTKTALDKAERKLAEIQASEVGK